MSVPPLNPSRRSNCCRPCSASTRLFTNGIRTRADRSNTIIPMRSCSPSAPNASCAAPAIRSTWVLMLPLTSSRNSTSSGMSSLRKLRISVGLPFSFNTKSCGPRPVMARLPESSTCASTRTSATSLRKVTLSSPGVCASAGHTTANQRMEAKRSFIAIPAFTVMVRAFVARGYK